MDKWNVINRKESSISTAITQDISVDDFPYMVMKPCFTFAFGELAALCNDKETAEMIAKAMNVLNQWEPKQ